MLNIMSQQLANNLKKGTIGQIQGPFAADESINFQNYFVKLGIFIGEKDLMDFDWHFPVKINNIDIIIGSFGMYELEEPIQISSISFPQGAQESVMIDYVILDI